MIAWYLLTRLGEAQILLPAMLALLLWLAAQPATRPLAWRWALGTLLATAITTATKIAFIGFGVGIARIDFSGLSGHAMFAASLLPLMVALLRAQGGARLSAGSLLPGALLALLIAVSRVRVGAHSWSEVLLGGCLGLAVSLWVLATPGGAHRPAQRPRGAAWALAGWLLLLPLVAPRSLSHDWVTALSLRMSGHPLPYTREQMRLEHRRRLGAPLSA
jgi:membrane-associated phospholipid phosphatase